MFLILVVRTGFEPVSFKLSNPRPLKSVIASTIPPPDYFATFRLPPELLTVPTHDLERFILSQRTYSIFVPLYFGLISLFLILIPFYFGTNLLIFKYEFFKGTGYLVADDRLELPI